MRLKHNPLPASFHQQEWHLHPLQSRRWSWLPSSASPCPGWGTTLLPSVWRSWNHVGQWRAGCPERTLQKRRRKCSCCPNHWWLRLDKTGRTARRETDPRWSNQRGLLWSACELRVHISRRGWRVPRESGHTPSQRYSIPQPFHGGFSA